MNAACRIFIMAEMHGRDLLRRHVALVLLVALPLSFYLTSSGSTADAIATGGVAMAFAVGGATLFSALSSMDVDQRLVLAGYQPIELLLGRVVFLAPLAIVIAGGFTALMAVKSNPAQAGPLLLGVSMVALQAVPFGLVVGAIVPRELEGTLVLIGVVGIELAVSANSVVSKVLPFYGPRRLIEGGHHRARRPVRAAYSDRSVRTGNARPGAHLCRPQASCDPAPAALARARAPAADIPRLARSESASTTHRD